MWALIEGGAVECLDLAVDAGFSRICRRLLLADLALSSILASICVNGVRVQAGGLGRVLPIMVARVWTHPQPTNDQQNTALCAGWVPTRGDARILSIEIGSDGRYGDEFPAGGIRRMHR